jgi:hypothetical protein
MAGHEKPPFGGTAFDTLLNRLAHVPKEEVAAEEAKHRAMRERLKAKGESKADRKRRGKGA